MRDRHGMWVTGRVCGRQAGYVGDRQGMWVTGRLCG